MFVYLWPRCICLLTFFPHCPRVFVCWHCWHCFTYCPGVCWHSYCLGVSFHLLSRCDKMFPGSPTFLSLTSGCWSAPKLSLSCLILNQVCMIFVFSCILEFIVVTAHIRSGKKNRGEMVITFLLLFIIPHLSLILIYTKLKRRVSLKNKLFSHHHGHKDPILQVLENLPNITRLALISVAL